MSDSRTLKLTILGDAKQAIDALTSVETKTGGVAGLVEKHWKTATVAAGAAGVAITKLNDREKERTAGLRELSVQTGMSEGELRDLTRSLADHTFSLDDVIAAQQRLVATGVETREEFERIIPAADTLATAMGVDVTKAIDIADRALSALGIPMTELEDHMDTITFLAKSTTINMDNLGMAFRREQRAIDSMGLTLDDVAVAMAALEANGRRGPRAVMGFQEAIKNAEGDVDAFWQALEVGNDQLDIQRQRLADSAGMTEALAAAQNSTFTTYDKLKFKLQEQIFAHAGLIEKAANLAPALIAIPPIMKGITMATGALRTALMLLAGASGIGLVLIAVAALIAVGVLLWKNWDTVKEKAGQLRDWVVQQFTGMVTGARDAVLGFARDTIDAFTRVASWIGDRIDSIHGAFTPLLILLGPIGALALVWRFRDQVGAAFGQLRDTVTTIFNGIRDTIERVVNAIAGFVDRIKRAIDSIPSLSDIPGAGLVSGAVSTVGGWIPGRAAGGPVGANGTYIVGERGPELLHMGSGRGHVSPGLGGAIHLHLNGTFIGGPREFEDAVTKAIIAARKRGAGI